MRRLLLLSSVLLTGFAVACGGGGDDDDGSSESSGAAPTSAPAATSAPASNDAPITGGGGVSTLVIGDETYRFNVECQFGTAIIRGPGESNDGTPAWIDAGMPFDDNGRPDNRPEDVEIKIRVGIAELFGSPTYDYSLDHFHGSVVSYEDDGKATSGSGTILYGDGSEQKPGFTEGDELALSWQISCS